MSGDEEGLGCATVLLAALVLGLGAAGCALGWWTAGDYLAAILSVLASC